ncbi:hypothetical protein [Noviherbaspirillum sp.]|uniref:hypothetical protein n=1 Tax=Noviherbaspirillum sp. TaxID=1926288 RepID=UPI002B493016|nr:hypothetical protein [Noviherbaspirillum sp.]HJV83366.1 hypothetical protein [Noviherbaspirillum sp.]
MTTRPDNLFEAASYDLNKFRERRMAERRATQRDTPDRRMQHNAAQPPGSPDCPADDAGLKKDDSV